MNRVRHLAALFALCAVLVVTAVSVLPGHDHDSASSRPCLICQSGHLPCLQASGAVQFSAQMPVAWQHAPENLVRWLDSAPVTRAPRAPPV